MSTPTFAELLTYHLMQTGISDSELARSIGVRRQTVFRWKEGLVERPRAREDVLRCAQKLRLTATERDLLLLAAGFAPEALDPAVVHAPAVPTPGSDNASTQSPLPDAIAPLPASAHLAPEAIAEDQETAASEDEPVVLPDMTVVDNELGTALSITPVVLPTLPRQDSSSTPATALKTLVMAGPTPALPTWLHHLPKPQLWSGVTLVLLVFVGLVWQWRPEPVNPPALTPTQAEVKITVNPPPTPLVFPIAPPGQALVVVAPFTNYAAGEGYNAADRIQLALDDEIAAANLLSITITIWPDQAPTADQVRQLVSKPGIALVIWGEYDSGRVRINWTVGDQKTGQDKTEKTILTLTSPTELISTINTRLPEEIRSLALTALGRVLRDRGGRENQALATAAFRRALQAAPADDKTSALLNFYLGHLAEQTKTVTSYDQAIAYYSEALKRNGLLFDAYYNRGTVYLKRAALLPLADPAIRQNLDKAIADLTQVLKVSPKSLAGHLNRGIAYYERNQANDLAGAVADFDQMLRLNAQAATPDSDADAYAYYHRGLAYVRMGKQEEWIADFTKTLTLQSNQYGATLNGLCWGYALDQQPDLALPYCDQAVERDQTGASRDSRGIVYAQLGRNAEAIVEFNAYLTWVKSLQPETAYVRYRGPVVETWITQLTGGENPFTPATLAALR